MTLTILVLHACDEIREHTAEALVGAGMTVRLAANGVEGLADLRSVVPDAIITGINMPGMDGFGFIEAVRRQDRLRGIPVLVMTRGATPELRTRARNAGAAGWLVWPFDPARLAETLRMVTA